MSLGIALNNAVSGLRINQQSLAVLSQNLANANTDGYSRQVLAQSAVTVGGFGNGVQMDDIIRKVDVYLERSAMTQSSEAQRSSVVNEYYQSLQVLLGQPGAQDSLDEHFTTFFNVLGQMADHPDRTSLRTSVLSAAVTLSDQISSLAYEVESLRFQADADIAGTVSGMNSAMRKLFELNDVIARAHGANQSTAALLDERDKALRTLAESVDIQVNYNFNGTVGVTAGNGAPLVDGIMRQVRYTPQGGVGNFISDARLYPLEVIGLDNAGVVIAPPAPLVTGGTSSQAVSGMTGGKLQGLVQLRDEMLPLVLEQLDMLASTLRDQVNAIHNNGSGFPPAESLTGTKLVGAQQGSYWAGSVRIAVLNSDGSPIPAQYADEAQYTGFRPLTLDLELLSATNGGGVVTVNNILDEINNHFGTSGPKVSLSSMNNIQLVSDTDFLPSGATSIFNFDLDLENLTSNAGDVYVSGITVRNDVGSDITEIVTDAPRIMMTPTDTYRTYNMQQRVDVTLASTEGLEVGDWIYLGPPGLSDINGIDPVEITGYFQIQTLVGNVVGVDANGAATSSGPLDDGSGVYAKTKYATIEGGEKRRTFNEGQMQVDLSDDLTSEYYDITVEVGVVNADGNLSTSQITYRVNNNVDNLRNKRYDVASATGSAIFTTASTTQEAMRAILVDANGNEIAKVNGEYVYKDGYIKLFSRTEEYVIALDELDSEHLGNPSGVPSEEASGRGFSHYFGLNNFFINSDTSTGEDELKNSAINLAVQQRLIDDPNLISSGTLVLSRQPTDEYGNMPRYTYERFAGSNETAQALADLANRALAFDAAGGLPQTQLSLVAYTAEMLGTISARTSAATDDYENAQLLYEGFSDRAKAVSGVNIDEELANTIIFQNAYSATARIVTVVDEMFQQLIDSF